MFNAVNFLIATLLVSFVATPRVNVAQHEIFSLHFEQGTKVIEADDEVTLKKEPFDIVFEFPEPMGVLVHASFNPETYDEAIGGKLLKKLPGFENTGMAEEVFNKDNEILLNATAPGYWYYDNDEAHRFNEAKEKSGKITCKRHVVQLNEIDSNRVTNVEDVVAPLNLVFISYERGESDKETLEIHRVPVKINWEE